MKLPRYKIEAAVASEETRYTLNSVYCDPERGILVATDGHQIVVVPCETDKHDQAGLVPARAFAVARAEQKRIPRGERKKKQVSMGLNGRILIRNPETGSAISMPREKGKFPDCSKIFKGFKGPPDAIIDIDVLNKAVAAMRDGTERASGVIAIWIDKVHSPTQSAILISPDSGTPDRAAMVMPCRGFAGLTAEKVLKSIKLAPNKLPAAEAQKEAEQKPAK